MAEHPAGRSTVADRPREVSDVHEVDLVLSGDRVRRRAEDDEEDQDLGSRPGSGSAVPVYAGIAGVVAALGALDQALKQQGLTLAQLTIGAGPLSGSLVANWPLCAMLALLAYLAFQKWSRREAWDRRQARKRDEAAEAQVRALRLVATRLDQVRQEVHAVRGELVAVREDHGRRLSRLEEDFADIRADRRRGRQPSATA